MKIFVSIFLLVGSAQAATPNNSSPELGVYADVIKTGCGEVGGQIFEKEVSTNGRIYKTRKLVCKNDPRIDEIAKEYAEQPKLKVIEKSVSRIGQEDGKIYKCKMVHKYLYCNNDHFYEKVGPVEDALLTRPSMDVFNNNRPKDKVTDQINKDKGMKKPSIIER